MNQESEIRNHESMIPRFPPLWAEVFGEDRRGIFAECSVKDVRFVWRWVCPGPFLMGSPKDETGRWEAEGPQHKVTLTRGFWLGETPVTQAQWQAVMGENPSQFKDSDELPVDSVTWHQCRSFAAKLNDLIPGLDATLPTEAQWEYACRAGTQSAFHDGSPCTQPEGKDPALNELGWFEKNSEGKPHNVKEKAPNAWGFYDMHGNVWEWCRDAWTGNYNDRAKGAIDPESTKDDDSALRVLRGGSWGSRARLCRSAYRFGDRPGGDWLHRGLRLAAGQNEPRAAEPQ